MVETACYSLDVQGTLQSSLALVPDGHRARLVGMSPFLIPPPTGLWSA